MSASRKKVRKPGKKTGARIKHTIALKPLGMRNLINYELPTRAAILALEHGVHNADHIAHLYSLGDMARRITVEMHVKAHADTVIRLCEQIYQDGCCKESVANSMRVSTNLLLEWMNEQSNFAISNAANEAIKEIGL
jgi:hypothetical protein